MAWVPSPGSLTSATVDEYLTLERTADTRHEYLDGCVYAMAGESPDHGTICMNLYINIGAQLRGTPCRGFAKDMKVRCGPPHALGAAAACRNTYEMSPDPRIVRLWHQLRV